MVQKETILGNYLGFARFPLDCESIAYLQVNTQLLSVIARLSGCDKLILSGCDITSGSTRAEGYVYIRTGNDLVGEVVYFKGGTGTRCKIQENTDFNVTANGETFRNAYTKRILESSSSPSDMAWGDFAKLSDISNAALKTAVNGKAAASHTHAISNVTGLQSALDGKAASNHTHNYSAPGHTHDDRYYTESEINTKLSGKSDINHTHNYSAPGHTHDDRYYTEAEIDTKLSGKSDINHTHNYSAPGHTHDERYYTEAEVDTKTAALQSAINAKQEQLASEVEVNNDHYKIKAVRYGKVVNVHINGYLTDSYSRTSITVPDSIFPTRLIPSQTVWAISIESNSAGTTNTLDNMHIAWLQRNKTYNILEFGCIKSTQQQAHINATFTYILD